jgi:hypothetical protein
VGALWRLIELAFFKKMSRVSSVSGESVTAGLLGLKWSKRSFNAAGATTNFVDEVVEPIRGLEQPARRVRRSCRLRNGRLSEDLHREPYVTDVVLTNGGVCDNRGIETAWKLYETVLISDGGRKMQA